MPLTEAQRFEVRRWTGDSPSDADLDAAYDRLGSVREVIAETLATRRANFLANPASLTVVGEYAQSTGENIRGMDELLSEFEVADITTDPASSPGTTKVLVRDGEDDLSGR